MKAIIVGAGLSGVTAARLLKDQGWDVTVFEKSNLVSGSCHDYKDTLTGDMVHSYGPHAFHTKSFKLWQFANRFAPFMPFALQVNALLASGKVIPVPFNTISREIVGDWATEDIIREVFVPYSTKMWGIEWDKLPASITARVAKMRQSADARYHLDVYQGIPAPGFKVWIESILDGIEVITNCQPEDWRNKPRDLLIYTGTASSYFDVPELPWRSLDFTFSYEKRSQFHQLNGCRLDLPWHRQVDQSYWPNSVARSTESVVCREVAVAFNGSNIPFYPEPHLSGGLNTELAERCKAEPRTLFIGRLGTYKYINMDEAMRAAAKKISLHLGITDPFSS